MKEIFNSQIKADILLYLGLRGAASGRKIAKAIGASPTPVYKALTQLTKAQIVTQNLAPPLYRLNPFYPYYPELLSMINKSAKRRKSLPYLPTIKPQRRIDAEAVYELLPYQSTKSGPSIPKLSKLDEDYIERKLRQIKEKL